MTTVAIAVEGVSLKNENDALACAILQRASGSGPRVKWGSSPSSLHKQVSSAAGREPFGLSTFNASYTDSGLFGVVLCSTSNVAGFVSNIKHYNYNKYNFHIYININLYYIYSWQKQPANGWNVLNYPMMILLVVKTY